jgi:hypothetical protein
MTIRPGRIGWSLALVLALAATGPALADTGSDRTLVGRLVDINGASVAGATVLVFLSVPEACAGHGLPPGASMASRSAAGSDRATVQLRTDADGGFTALLPPGRYMVAAVKRGYDVSMTEAHSLSSRVLRMRLRPSVTAPYARIHDTDWALREQRADILRDEAPVLTPAIFVVREDDPTRPQQDGAAGGAARLSGDPSRALLGPVDGDVVQSIGAGEILGIESGAPLDAQRATTVSVRAPIRPGLGWQVDGRSLRSRSVVEDGAEQMAARSDRMIFTLDRTADPGQRLNGQLRAGFGNDGAGTAQVRDGLLEGGAEIGYSDNGDQVVVAMQAWSSRSSLEGTYLTLDPGTAGSRNEHIGVNGVALYAGDRRDLGARGRIDYGLELRQDTTSAPGRVAPKVGWTQQGGGDLPLVFRTEVILDPGRPGGRVSVEGSPGNAVQVAASVAVLPANALTLAPDGPGVAPGPGLVPAGARNADLKEIGLSVARDFGPVSGTLSGSLGRTGRRSAPVVEDGPLPVVSFGGERFYETRIGVAYRPTSTEMQLGYRSVATEGDSAADQSGTPLDYRRVDLVVTQGLPSPRSLAGARLRALVAWQGMDYGAIVTGSGGGPLTGIASRLTGGVGLSF